MMVYSRRRMVVVIMAMMTLDIVGAAVVTQRQRQRDEGETISVVVTTAPPDDRPGIVDQPIQGAIVGGQLATKAYPYFATTLYNELCGATLIYEDILMTAAHCVGAFDGGVTIGTNDRSSTTKGYTRQLVRQRPHPKYSNVTYANDIMLVKFDIPVKSNVVKPINYTSNPKDPAAGTTLTVIGFGLTAQGATQPSTLLRQVNVIAYSDQVCANDLSPSTDGSYITPAMFCAGVTNGGKDSCAGDSGGPIMNAATGVQVGIVSWGIGCAQASYPGVYTRVGEYYSWIRTNLCQMSANPPSWCPKITLSGTTVRILVQNDSNPRQNTWTIFTLAGNFRAKQTVWGKPNSLTTETIKLPPGYYELDVIDTAGDGNCCVNGQGYYEVDVVSGNTAKPVASRYGNFLYSTSIRFTVPKSTTRRLFRGGKRRDLEQHQINTTTIS